MAEDFRGEIVGIQALLNKLNAGKRPGVIKRSLFEGATLIAGWSKDKRLTGPRPRFLGVVSGRLRSSITASRTEQTGNTFISKIGTNVKYGHVHEKGFKGRVLVNSFTRITKKHGVQMVGSHFRNMNIKARPFLNPAIEDKDNLAEVLNILTFNINQAMQKS